MSTRQLCIGLPFLSAMYAGGKEPFACSYAATQPICLKLFSHMIRSDGSWTVPIAGRRSPMRKQAEYDNHEDVKNREGPELIKADRQSHGNTEDNNPPYSEHGQRRPQHHEQQEQGPKAELEAGVGRRYGGLGFDGGHGDTTIAAIAAKSRR